MCLPPLQTEELENAENHTPGKLAWLKKPVFLSKFSLGITKQDVNL